MPLTLTLLPQTYAVCRLSPTAPVPAWADGQGFVSISRNADELSVVCPQERVPGGVKADLEWRCFKFQGPFAFNETGILASVLEPLAQAKIGIFAVSTFDTDYLLIKSENLEPTLQALKSAGHTVS